MTQRATHYHTVAVNPVWSAGLVETTRIGSHIFYRFPNRSERATYQAALERRMAAVGHGRGGDDLIPEAVDESMNAEAAASDAEDATTSDVAAPAPTPAQAADPQALTSTTQGPAKPAEAPITTAAGEVAT